MPPPPPSMWEIQQDQTLLRSSEGTLDNALWQGIFFILKHPFLERQRIFYARTDKVHKGET